MRVNASAGFKFSNGRSARIHFARLQQFESAEYDDDNAKVIVRRGSARAR